MLDIHRQYAPTVGCIFFDSGRRNFSISAGLYPSRVCHFPIARLKEASFHGEDVRTAQDALDLFGRASEFMKQADS